MMNKKLMAGRAAQGSNPVTIRGMARKAVNQIKKVPAVDKASSLLNQAKHSWKMRAGAALLSVPLLCGPITITGCDKDNPMSAQDQDLTGKVVAFVDASGTLAIREVLADRGDTLTISFNYEEIDLPQSEVLGVGGGVPTRKTVTFAKGNYLDSYGDALADVEYLHGKLGAGYRSLTDNEYVVVEVSAHTGTTTSGKQIAFFDEVGEDYIDLLIYADEYWIGYATD